MVNRNNQWYVHVLPMCNSKVYENLAFIGIKFLLFSLILLLTFFVVIKYLVPISTVFVIDQGICSTNCYYLVHLYLSLIKLYVRDLPIQFDHDQDYFLSMRFFLFPEMKDLTQRFYDVIALLFIVLDILLSLYLTHQDGVPCI